MKKPRKDTPLRIAYLGPEGTHSHEACLRRYGEGIVHLPAVSFREALDALTAPGARRADAALLPVENSIEGPVTQSLDQLALTGGVTITESFCLEIRQCLLARRNGALKSIRRLYSHPQALGQSRRWIERRLPGAEVVETASTAEAARRAAAEPHTAAIAGPLAGRLHDLRVLARNVQDQQANTTRFIEVRRVSRTTPRPPPSPGDETRALLHVVLPNRPGALLHALQPFQTANLNLSFIQSRPLAGRPWEYAFFIEVQVTGQERAFAAVLGFLAAFMERSRLLGRYTFRRRPLGSPPLPGTT
jgi:chorismate mutase/prephenate dehydratase